MRNVVVVGATGHFGLRICRRLVGEQSLRLIVSSRAIAAARRVAEKLQSHSANTVVEPVALDQNSPSFSACLGALNPNIVIHTVGPYQGQNYVVARACIEHGSHYIDLADGRQFVQGFDALREDALKKNLLLVTGASHFAWIIECRGIDLPKISFPK